MPFQPTFMSLRKGVADVIHTSANESPLEWQAWQIVSPLSGMLLDASKWTFAVDTVDGENVGKIVLLPLTGSAQDTELKKLAAFGEQLTVQVVFKNGLKGDLVVNLWR